MVEAIGEQINNVILENRYTFALVLFIAVIFVGTLPLIGYRYGWLSLAQVRVTLSGIGAIGTLSLAIFTVLSILETRKQSKARVKEQDKYIQEQILRETNNIRFTVEQNEDKLYNPDFDWTTALEFDEEVSAVEVDLDPLEMIHPTAVGRFKDENPSAQESIKTYNECLLEIDSMASQIIDESYEYISQCIDSFEITDSDDRLMSSDEVLDLVFSGKKLRQDGLDEEDPDWWAMEGELRKQIEKCVDGGLEEFFDEKQNLELKSSVVKDELDNVRDYILDEYPVQPQDYPTS
ncbi:MAG: hypothetical protein ACOCQY_00730 [Halorhabdus sp.]